MKTIEMADSYAALVEEIDRLERERVSLRAALIRSMKPGEIAGRVRLDEERVLRCDAKLREGLAREGFYEAAVRVSIDTEKVRNLAEKHPAVAALCRWNRRRRLVVLGGGPE